MCDCVRMLRAMVSRCDELLVMAMFLFVSVWLLLFLFALFSQVVLPDVECYFMCSVSTILVVCAVCALGF